MVSAHRAQGQHPSEGCCPPGRWVSLRKACALKPTRQEGSSALLAGGFRCARYCTEYSLEITHFVQFIIFSQALIMLVLHYYCQYGEKYQFLHLIVSLLWPTQIFLLSIIQSQRGLALLEQGCTSRTGLKVETSFPSQHQGGRDTIELWTLKEMLLFIINHLASTF